MEAKTELNRLSRMTENTENQWNTQSGYVRERQSEQHNKTSIQNNGTLFCTYNVLSEHFYTSP